MPGPTRIRTLSILNRMNWRSKKTHQIPSQDELDPRLDLLMGQSLRNTINRHKVPQGRTTLYQKPILTDNRSAEKQKATKLAGLRPLPAQWMW